MTSNRDVQIRNPLEIREIVLNCRKPVILQNFLTQWECFQCTLDEWCEKYDATSKTATSLFERAKYINSNEPQWERKRELVKLTTSEFLQEHNVDKNYWTGLNYKRVKNLPEECKKGIDFACFGFPLLEDSSFWLSSKGANTPCHFDTYGCNIVVQIYGRKSWLLFPPNTPLTTTRIPYEESSVYCTENFYSPNLHNLSEFLKLEAFAYRCILEPNDVLIVPRHWWHYVETLETSLSVNSWIPLENDVDAQIEECIVNFLIEKMIKGVNSEQVKYILNPNQINETIDELELFKILHHLLSVQESDESNEKLQQCRHPYQYLSKETYKDFIASIKYNYHEIQPLPSTDFKKLLLENSKRYSSTDTNERKSPINSLKEALINSFCSQNVIKKIKNEFMKRCKDLKIN